MKRFINFALIAVFVLCSGVALCACGPKEEDKTILTIDNTVGISWDLGKYNGKYFSDICGGRTVFKHTYDREDHFPVNETYYLFMFDSQASVKFNGEVVETLEFTLDELKALYYDTDNENYIYNDLLNANEITGNLGDQEERFLSVGMTYIDDNLEDHYYNKVNILAFTLQKGTIIEIY